MASKFHNWFGATAIALCMCMGSTVAPAFAQQVNQSTETEETAAPKIQSQTPDIGVSTTETQETTEPSLSAEEQELDTLLLGPWARMAGAVNAPLTDEMEKRVEARCRTPMQFSRLNFGADVVRSLPTNRAHLVGDIVYYRTPKGIQILDNRTDTLILLPKVQKTTTKDGRIIWRLTNNRFRMLLRFTNTRNRGGRGEFLAAIDGIYLRCIRNPAAANQ